MKRTLFFRVFMLVGMITAVITPACRQNQTNSATTLEATQAVRFEPVLEPTQQPTATPEPTMPVEFSGDGLEAIFYSSYELDDLPPDTPLTVYFSEPMNSAHNRPLLFSPSVGGKFSWNDDHTMLTFQPEPAFLSGRGYTVSVNASLESSAGEKFSPIQRWRVHMRDVPAVSRRLPNDTQFSEYKPSILLQFSRTMNHESTQSALSVSPPIGFETTWIVQELQITLTEPMQFGKEYEFTLAKTAVSINREHMIQPYTWSIRLSDTMRTATWPTQSNPDSPLALDFNYPIDITQLETIAAIEPAIGGSWTWNEENTSAVFEPNGRFPTDTAYTVTFPNPLFDQEQHALPQPEPFTFTTPSAILSAKPAHDSTMVASKIEIQFDRPMNQEAAETAVSITPTTDGTFVWEDNTLYFTPETGYLQPTTQYTVTINPSAISADGEIVLQDDYNWSFRTGSLTTLASFGSGPNVQVVDENGRRAIQFQATTTNAILVSFELYQYGLDQFLPAYVTHFRESWWGDDQTIIDTSNLRLVAEWQMETAQSANEWENIQETILPNEADTGLYVLNLKAGELNDQLFVVLSDAAITAKIGDEQVIAWVTDINGDVLPDVPVWVYARNGRILTEGSTNSLGIFESSLSNFLDNDTTDDTPMLVVAEHAGKLTITGLQHHWRNGGYWRWESTTTHPSDYAIYTYTDRPIYRPGHTVYFKSIIRDDNDAELSIVDAGVPVSAQIRDARNNLVRTIDLRTNDFGTVNGEFTIADGAMLGTYHVEIVVNGEMHKQAFKVEDYRKPDYEVTVTTDREHYFKSETIEITVDTRYFFDEPVANADIEINRFELQENNQWSGQPGDYIWYESYGTALRGTTDENGRFTTTMLIPQDVYFNDYNYYYGSNLRQITWGLEATVNDGSNQTVSGFAVVELFNVAEKISIDHNGYSHKPGEPVTIQATVTDLDGTPINNRDLTVKLLRYNSSSYNYDTTILTESFTTDASGTAVTQFTTDEPGYYRLSVEGFDSRNRRIKNQSWLYIFDGETPSWYGGDNDINISAEKVTYVAGETAVLLIESSFAGPGLLTIERGTVRREELVTLTPPITRVELPIIATDAPNIYVTINGWEPLDNSLENLTYESVPDSRLRKASVNLSVPATDKQLSVAITPDKETYAPGEEATFTVRVTNHAGVPVSAEVSMALVDEAIFALSDELSGPIYDGFYFERANGIRTYHSMSPSRYLGGGMGGGGGDGLSAQSPRQDFQDTAVWQPTLTTDFNGEATLTVTLPDNLTRWRMTAKAATADTQVGETTTTIVTQQDVLIRPLLPRILTTGDNIQLTALIHNNTSAAQNLAVSLQEVGETARLDIQAPITQTLALAAGEVRAVGWSVSGSSAGDTELLVLAQFSEDGDAPNPTGTADAIKLPLTVQPLAIPNVDVEIGQFTSSHTAQITLPDDAMELSTVNIQLSRSIAGSMLDGLNDLTGYPYGCVEQTMSKALPNAVVGRALTQLGIPMPDELPNQINAGVQRLYGFQHEDGGWGWWHDDKTDIYQTAWVIFGLTQTAQAGYEVDPLVIERGAIWLKENLSSMDERTRAFALYSLALAGHGDIDATQKLVDQRDELDTFAHAALALTLHELGDTATAFEMVELLTDTAIVTEGRAHWDGATHDGSYSRKTMASATRNTAIALSALSTIQPGHSLEADIVRWLMSQRRQFGWGTTNETSFAVLGLTDHLLASGYAENASETGFTVLINGETFSTGTLNRGEPTLTVSIPRSALADENEIVIMQDGERPLYFVITSRIYQPQGTIEANGVVTIDRTYFDLETDEPTTSFEAGELVKVQLALTLPDAASYLIIEDKLPAGLEALNEGLNTSSHISQAYNEPPRYYWEEYGYNQKEIRGDRVSFFVTELNAGSRTFSYIARATQSGSFTAMPAEVSAMYDPTIWGHSTSDEIIIRSK